MFSLIFHRLKENRNLKYAAKVQPFIQITKFWKIILKGSLYPDACPTDYHRLELVIRRTSRLSPGRAFWAHAPDIPSCPDLHRTA